MNTSFRKKFQIGFSILAAAAGLNFSAAAQSDTNQVPKFDEVYKLLREHFGAMNSEQLDAAIVRGLLDELKPQVLLVSSNAISTNATDTNLISRASVYDKSFAYLRVGQVSEGLANKFASEYEQLASTNKIKGMVVDLRFASGEDYAAAAKTADQFLNSEQPLITWGSGSAESTKKANFISVPVAILVNSETRGAAEALAAALHETHVGLILGSQTAGEARIFKDFNLQDGQKLRIAVAPIKVGKGNVLSGSGIKPDIEIKTTLEDDRFYFEDAYRTLARQIPETDLDLNTNNAATETNLPRQRLNEAELVRRHREGLSIEDEFSDTRRQNQEVRLVRDPVLARALDLLKGLAVVGQARPQ
jgi:C-terminal processing protease CtpA/Prc